MIGTKVNRTPCKAALDALEKRLEGSNGDELEISSIPGSWLPPAHEIAARFKKMQGGLRDMVLERMSGVSNNVIRDMRTGARKPNLELIGYYRSKGYSSDWILFGEENNPVDEGFDAYLSKLLSRPAPEKLQALAALAKDAQDEYAELARLAEFAHSSPSEN